MKFVDTNHMLAFDFDQWHQAQLFLLKGIRYKRIEFDDDTA